MKRALLCLATVVALLVTTSHRSSADLVTGFNEFTLNCPPSVGAWVTYHVPWGNSLGRFCDSRGCFGTTYFCSLEGGCDLYDPIDDLTTGWQRHTVHWTIYDPENPELAFHYEGGCM